VRLLSHVRAYWYLFPISLAGYALYSLGVVLLADLLQYLLDIVSGNASAGGSMIASVARVLIDDTADPVAAARITVPVAIILLTLMRAVGQFAGSYAMEYVARHLVHDLRCKLFDALLAAPAGYYDEQSQGSLVSRMTFNVEQVTGAATKAVKTLLRETLVLIGLVGYMLYLNWQLTLVVLLVAPLIALVVRWVGAYFRRYSRRIQVSMAQLTQVTTETTRGYREVRLYAGELQQRQRFALVSTNNLRQSLKLALTAGLSAPVIQLLLAGGLGLMLWFALDANMLAAFTAGSLAAFLTAAVQLGKPVRQLSGIQSVLQRGLAAAEDIFLQLDGSPENAGGNLTVSRATGDIRFDSVSFRYPQAQQCAVEELSFQIRAGSTVGLVGRSGSGKSTLVKLLLRFYNPDAGQIYLDEHPVTDYELPNLRQQFAVVSQQAPLFRDTVRNNIAYGALASSSDAQVTAAALAAQAQPFIEALPLGMQTQLVDEGASLSGGQRQRIALARALLKRAPLLILDEATSALDTHSEQQVQSAIDGLAEQCTTLIIAHRLSTVERADLILVMDAGHLVESGTHAQLIAQNGVYRQLCEREFVPT
jgi:subfamily B ATP-binding cassette protein MsbA